MNLRDEIGGMIQSGYQDSADPYEMAGQVLEVVAAEVRARCTPSGEAYAAGGDTLVYAVADWIAPQPTAPAHDHLGRNCPPSCPAHGHQPKDGE